MRGKILGFDAAGGTGAISGSDGKRYTFDKGEWRGDGPPTPGVYVDFDSADGSNATALFPEVKTVFAPGKFVAPEPAAESPPPPPPPAPPPPHAQQAPGGYPGQQQQGGFGQPGGPPPGYGQPGGAPGGYPQPGGAPGGYPQPGARPPYPGQQPPQQGYPGQQQRAPQPYPGQGAPSQNYPGQGGYPGQAQAYGGQKSKVVAGLLALFLGGLGAHKFYLGYTTEGIILLVANIVSILLWLIVIGMFGTMAISVIVFIEAIIYLTKSDEDFDRIYVQNKKAWF